MFINKSKRILCIRFYLAIIIYITIILQNIAIELLALKKGVAPMNNPKKLNFKQLFTGKRNSNKSNGKKSTKELLREYSSLVLYHPDLVMIFSPRGKVVSQNKTSFKQLFGYSPRQKSDFKKIISNESYHKLDSIFLQTLRGKTGRQDIEVKNKYGQMVYVVLTFIPIKKTDNEIKGICLIIKDITKYKTLNQTLQVNVKHLKYTQEVAEIGSWEYEIAEDKLLCSNSFYDIFGFAKSNHVPMNKPFQFVHPEDYEQTCENVTQAINNGTSYDSEFRIVHGKTNEIRHIRVKTEAIMKDHKPYKLIGVIKDCTVQKKLENNLKHTNKYLQYIFDNLEVGFWMRESIDGKITYLSKGIEYILQTPLAKLYEQPDIWKKMILHSHRKDVFSAYESLYKGKDIKIKYRIQTGDGTTKWIFEQTIPKMNKEGKITNLYGMITDISAEVEIQEKLKFLALYDPLTALPNQYSLYNKLNMICQNNQNRFALLYSNLDRLHIINDSLGHQVGDNLLKIVTNRITSSIPKDSYVARLNGDNFIIIIDHFTNKDDIFTIAEQIISNVGKKVMINEYELYTTISIGISFFPDDGDQKLTLLENAHSALYHAKQQGKNNYQFYSFSRDISSYKKYLLEKDMREAIVNEEFELYYQPQIHSKRMTIESAEALIRWNHKEWGIVTPNVFIQIAEENHLILEIGDWVIKRVCEQLREWKDKGYTLRPIGINISPIQFLKRDLVDVVRKHLKTYQIPGKYLQIEITEDSLLRNEAHILTTLAELKELGVQVAIDDFGTGYASLEYLREFQVDVLKIDQVFIQSRDGQHEIDRAIVSSILHLAKKLHIKTVAEGVEEFAQFEYLKQQECDLIQGYLFSRPVPKNTFEKMLKTGYLRPTKQKTSVVLKEERRKFYRFQFPNSVLGEMSIIEVNKRKVDLGSAKILIENISLGGIKILSTLKLPVHSNMIFKFNFKLLNKQFSIKGSLVWINEVKDSIFTYGVSFDLKGKDEDRLAKVINKMTLIHKNNQEFSNTNFINEDPYIYLRKKLK